MIGSVLDKVTGLFDNRFVLGLLLPVLLFAAGVGALVATMVGWGLTMSWWHGLGGSWQVAAAISAVVAIAFTAIVLGTQVVPITRLLEGYWRSPLLDRTAGRVGRWFQQRRRARFARDITAMGHLRSYVGFAPAEIGPVMPTRLGNVLKAAESYPGDQERWQLDAAFWWPRLYLIIPNSVREQLDSARSSMDQMVVLTTLSAAFSLASIGFGIAGIRPSIWLCCAIGAAILSRLVYLAAVSSAAVFGDLVRSCFDLFRSDLLRHVGWAVPSELSAERALWIALEQQLYRRGASHPSCSRVHAAAHRQPNRPDNKRARRRRSQSFANNRADFDVRVLGHTHASVV